METRSVWLTPQGIEALQTKKLHLEAQLKEAATALHDDDISEDDKAVALTTYDNIRSELDKTTALLSKAQILEAKSTKRATLGSTVNLDGEHKRQITLVDPHEADPLSGYVSIQSPLGQSIIGKRKDDTVRFLAPRGEVQYIIAGIQ